MHLTVLALSLPLHEDVLQSGTAEVKDDAVVITSL